MSNYNETADPLKVRAALSDIWNSMGDLLDDSTSKEEREASLLDDFIMSSGMLAEAAHDSQVPFHRLVTMSERLEHVKESVESALSSTTAGVTGFATLASGVGVAVWMASQGMIHPIDHAADQGFVEMLKEHPIGFGAPVAGAAAMAAYTLAGSLDRGYARLQGLTEAHDRLRDGAKPNNVDLIQRMSEPERSQYAGILRQVYTALKDRPLSDAEKFKQRLGDGLAKLIDDYQHRPDASTISTVLERIDERLADALNPNHSQVDAPSPTYQSPSSGLS